MLSIVDTGTEHKWRVEHAAAVEKALRGMPASLGSVVAAVRAVASNVRPGKTSDADFLLATAEGLVFEALVHTLGLVSPLHHISQTSSWCLVPVLRPSVWP